ncbi:hypothetical protein F4808DRAFT_457940 [Astrocystis sublimbata]|nr:hypothetical protein F4808DRAFT_457940 [Astrocystis sublimbata]
MRVFSVKVTGSHLTRCKTTAAVQRDVVRDTDLSIRFKHGKNTVVLFVDPMATFSQVQEELLDTLKERYPHGIDIPDSPDKMRLPSQASQIKFALPKDKTNPAMGWNQIDFELDEAPVDKGFQDNTMVAFAIQPEDADDADELVFEVTLPSYDDEGEDEPM